LGEGGKRGEGGGAGLAVARSKEEKGWGGDWVGREGGGMRGGSC